RGKPDRPGGLRECRHAPKSAGNGFGDPDGDQDGARIPVRRAEGGSDAWDGGSACRGTAGDPVEKGQVEVRTGSPRRGRRGGTFSPYRERTRSDLCPGSVVSSTGR